MKRFNITQHLTPSTQNQVPSTKNPELRAQNPAPNNNVTI